MPDLTDRLLAFAATLANDEEDLLVEAAKEIRTRDERIRSLNSVVMDYISPDKLRAIVDPLEAAIEERDERIRELEQACQRIVRESSPDLPPTLSAIEQCATACERESRYTDEQGRTFVSTNRHFTESSTPPDSIQAVTDMEQQLRAAQDTIASKDVQLNDVKQQMQDARNVASDKLKAAQERLARVRQLAHGLTGANAYAHRKDILEALGDEEYFAKHGAEIPKEKP